MDKDRKHIIGLLLIIYMELFFVGIMLTYVPFMLNQIVKEKWSLLNLCLELRNMDSVEKSELSFYSIPSIQIYNKFLILQKHSKYCGAQESNKPKSKIMKCLFALWQCTRDSQRWLTINKL